MFFHSSYYSSYINCDTLFNLTQKKIIHKKKHSCETILYICDSYEESHTNAQKLLRKYFPAGRAETTICLCSAVNIKRVRNMTMKIHKEILSLIKTNIVANHILVMEFEFVHRIILRGVLSYKDAKLLLKSIQEDLILLRLARKKKAQELARVQIQVDRNREISHSHSTRRGSGGGGGDFRTSTDTLLNIALDGSLRNRYGSLPREDSKTCRLKRSKSLPTLSPRDLGSVNIAHNLHVSTDEIDGVGPGSGGLGAMDETVPIVERNREFSSLQSGELEGTQSASLDDDIDENMFF